MNKKKLEIEKQVLEVIVAKEMISVSVSLIYSF